MCQESYLTENASMIQKNLTLCMDAMSLWTRTLDLFSSTIAYISKLWIDFEDRYCLPVGHEEID